MQISTLINVVGTGLITTALIIHVVCVASPYHVVADFSHLDDESKDLGPGIKEVLHLIAEQNTTVNFGLWLICYQQTVEHKLESDCTEFSKSKYPIGDWIKGCQAMGILGVIFIAIGIVIAAIHLAIQSRGDRLRLVPFFICGFCVFGGSLIFIGDMIMAANYRNVTKDLSFPKRANEILEDQFNLSWGFGLDIITIILAFGGGALHMFARVKADNAVF